jgi:hypothetical protein
MGQLEYEEGLVIDLAQGGDEFFSAGELCGMMPSVHFATAVS